MSAETKPTPNNQQFNIRLPADLKHGWKPMRNWSGVPRPAWQARLWRTTSTGAFRKSRR